MSRSSSEWKNAVQMTHVTCGGSWDLYSLEWPPQLAVCPTCRAVLKLVAHDVDTKRVSFRRI